MGTKDKRVGPLIGMTADFHTKWMGAAGDIFHYRLKDTYIQSLRTAGGVPVILPYLDSPGEIGYLAKTLDGLVVSGSPEDIDPFFYGGSKRPSGGYAVRRHAFEMGLVSECIERGLPVLGICGGLQLINVLYGGTLLADIGRCIKGAFEHQADYFTPSHGVEVLSGSLLHKTTGRLSFEVNSTHHQAVCAMGAGLIVSALAPDGVVEAIEAPGEAFVLGVQWHPEALCGYEPSVGIFKAFCKRARAGR